MPLDDPWLGLDPTTKRPPAVPVAVYRYDPDAAEPYEPMPHVQCLGVRVAEGADPGSATFRYNLDPRILGPHSVEEALSTASSAPGIVSPGDRLAVFATNPTTGADEPLFDGVVLGFRAQLGPRTEEVPLQAVGIAARCRDTPVPGALMRQADQPQAAGADVQTDLPARFNPRGVPNASAADVDSGEGIETFPVFADPEAYYADSASAQRAWTLPMAVRYLLYTRTDTDLVQSPGIDPRESIDDVLVAREAIDGTPYDPENPGTYTEADLACPDAPITGRDWPTLVKMLVGEKGFGMAFDVKNQGSGHATELRLFHPQRGTPVDLWLSYGPFDPTTSNVTQADLTRDLAGTANAWLVEGGPRRHEASWVLWPLFPMASGDASASNLKSYDRSAADPSAAAGAAYRLYGADETGEGHYDPGTSTPLTTSVNLDGLLGTGQWVVRRRKPIGELLTTDAAGKPLKYRLAISTDYTGDPGVWDGTGTWQPVQGGFRLLQDRIGILITADNPNKWHVGKSDVTGHPYRQGVVKGVEAQATTAVGKNFSLRLTCVVEGDKTVSYTTGRSDRSPLPYEVTRRVDARDRYRYEAVAATSEFNATADPVIVRDDTDDCHAEASALQAATEAGILDGQVTIPYLTKNYAIGDRIRGINGRNLGLRTDAGSDSLGAAVYPVVVGISWALGPRQQTTTLHLSDASTLRGYLPERHRGRATAHGDAAGA